MEPTVDASCAADIGLPALILRCVFFASAHTAASLVSEIVSDRTLWPAHVVVEMRKPRKDSSWDGTV